MKELNIRSNNAMEIIERSISHLRYGEYGDYAENEDNGRKIVRISQSYTRYPYCNLYENGKFIRKELSFREAISFLFNQNLYEFI